LSKDITTKIVTKEMREFGNVANMEDTKNSYKTLVGKTRKDLF
jgi:hypothetical protein